MRLDFTTDVLQVVLAQAMVGSELPIPFESVRLRTSSPAVSRADAQTSENGALRWLRVARNAHHGNWKPHGARPQ